MTPVHFNNDLGNRKQTPYPPRLYLPIINSHYYKSHTIQSGTASKKACGTVESGTVLWVSQRLIAGQ